MRKKQKRKKKKEKHKGMDDRSVFMGTKVSVGGLGLQWAFLCTCVMYGNKT